jgi:hypothetical protein
MFQNDYKNTKCSSKQSLKLTIMRHTHSPWPCTEKISKILPNLISQRDSIILDNSHNFVCHIRDDTINTVAFITSISEVLEEGQVRAALHLFIVLSQFGDKRRHSRVALPILLMDNGFQASSHIFLFCIRSRSTRRLTDL